MSDRGIKIVKLGFPITETNPENMVFTSAKGVLGWRETVDLNATTDSNGKIETEHQHGLEYIPIVFIYVTSITGRKISVPNQWRSDDSPPFLDYILEENFYSYIDDDKVYIKALVERYEPFMGGDVQSVVGHEYTFNIIYYFNELNDEV